ncbi:MAG: alpha/beta hydrolase [Acetobacteraceae bacterium]
MAIETRDIEFHRPAGVPLLARIYRPEGEGPFPGVLEVHGGAWTSGDRFNNVSIAEDLAANGILVMSIDFRMPPVARYPDTVVDVNHGIRWLKAHAMEYGSRADLVGGLGTSSGGHLLLLNALRPRDPRYAATAMPGSDVDASLRFGIVCWPVADPLTRYRVMQQRGNDRLVQAHNQFWPSEADMEEGSPQHILDRGEAVSLPPMLIMQGTADSNLTDDMAERLAGSYRRRGGSITYESFPDQPHAFIPNAPTAPDSVRALEMIRAFIRGCC